MATSEYTILTRTTSRPNASSSRVINRDRCLTEIQQPVRLAQNGSHQRSWQKMQQKACAGLSLDCQHTLEAFRAHIGIKLEPLRLFRLPNIYTQKVYRFKPQWPRDTQELLRVTRRWLWGGASSSKASSYWHGRVGVPMAGLMFGDCVVWCCLYHVFLKNGSVKRSICQGSYNFCIDFCSSAVGGFKTTFNLFSYFCKKDLKNSRALFSERMFWKQHLWWFFRISGPWNWVLPLLLPQLSWQNWRCQKNAPNGHENSNISKGEVIWCVQKCGLFCLVIQVTLPCKLSYELFVPRGCVLRNTL